MNRMWRWLAVACAAIHLFAAAPASAQMPTDEPGFTAFVAEQLRKEMRDVQVVIKAPLTLSIGSAQANLDRIYAFCKANANGCATELRIFIRGVVEATRNQGDRPTKEALRVVVRSAEYIRQSQEQLGLKAVVPSRPLVEGLVLVPVLDSPRTVRLLNDRDRDALGLTLTQSFDIGIANVRRGVRPLTEVAKAIPHGQFGSLTGDYYQTSRLALVDSWAPLAKAQGGVLLVAVPAADVLLYSSEDSSAAVDALRALTRNVMSRSPKPLSDRLLRWTPKGWQSVP
ncbi:hypothetical protein [Bradyrhizobium manausense]|nr:hypothetical protein [Bradyrhizobium manausense]